MRISLFLALLFISSGLSAQADTLFLDLDELVTVAESDAPEAAIAATRLNNNYWRYQSFLANYKPQINFSATLPNLNRSISVITLPDGNDAFINRSLMRNDIGLQLQQDIALTGGRIFASTGLQRIDLFSANNGGISYLSSPISIGLVQPIFGFNSLKWDKRVEPLRYEEARKNYSQDQADIGYRAAQQYFDVLIAQLNLEAARRDQAEADTLYEISQGRFSVGKIAETELLQIELNARNAAANLARSQFNLQNSTERLRDFLGLQQATFFRLEVPDDLPTFIIDLDVALQQARSNRSETVAFERRVREAERDVAQAEGTTGFQMDIFASFGLSQTATTLSDAYQDPLNQEQLQLGINVPVADWGKTRAQLEIARSNEQIVRMQVDQDRVNFEREVIIKVQQFEQVKEQVNLADRSYEIAQKRLDITRRRYRIGKIDITELNLAISEEANARRSYVNALRDFWLAYYDLRRLTLYDFAKQQSLVEPE